MLWRGTSKTGFECFSTNLAGTHLVLNTCNQIFHGLMVDVQCNSKVPLCTMVGHLFQNDDTIYVRFFPTYTCNHSCYTIYVRFLSRILAFYSQVYDHFLTNAHIYAHKKNPSMRYKQACGTCGRRKLSYKRHRIIPSAKNTFMYDGAEK